MENIEELRLAIEVNREYFTNALKNSEAEWNSGNGDRWGPKAIFAHVLDTEIWYSNRISEVLTNTTHTWETGSLSNLDHAMQLQQEVITHVNSVFSSIEQGDLKKYVEMYREYSHDIAGVLHASADHFIDHMQQINSLNSAVCD